MGGWRKTISKELDTIELGTKGTSAEVNKSTTYNPKLTLMVQVYCLVYPVAVLYIE